MNPQELESVNSLLSSTLESTQDGILVVDRAGKITLFNRRFLELWRIPKDIVESRSDEKAIGFVLDQLVDPDAFLRKVKELYADDDAESHDRLVFKDGRAFDRYSRPQLIGNKAVGRVWCFRDVTEQVRAEQSLLARNAEMEKLLKNMVGREQQMIELKDRVKKLEEKSG